MAATDVGRTGAGLPTLGIVGATGAVGTVHEIGDGRALGHDAEVLAAELTRLARHHQPRLLRVLLVGPMRVGDAHGQHAAVAVHVFGGQAFHRHFVERVRPRG